MPSGSIPPNPSELIGSELLSYIINCLKHEFDFIIIDTPPVIAASDALLLAPRTDGTILVVKSGHVDRKIIKNAVDQYRAAKQPILGMILNRVNMQKEGYYRYYQKYYSSYYGQQ
jgi:capsular exopolysaccharide synthesis family protein